MGGKILEFRGEKEWNAGEARGRQEGRAEGKVLALVDMVHDGIFTASQAEEMAGRRYGTSPADFRKLLYEQDTEERMQG